MVGSAGRRKLALTAGGRNSAGGELPGVGLERPGVAGGVLVALLLRPVQDRGVVVAGGQDGELLVGPRPEADLAEAEDDLRLVLRDALLVDEQRARVGVLEVGADVLLGTDHRPGRRRQRLDGVRQRPVGVGLALPAAMAGPDQQVDGHQHPQRHDDRPALRKRAPGRRGAVGSGSACPYDSSRIRSSRSRGYSGLGGANIGSDRATSVDPALAERNSASSAGGASDWFTTATSIVNVSHKRSMAAAASRSRSSARQSGNLSASTPSSTTEVWDRNSSPQITATFSRDSSAAAAASVHWRSISPAARPPAAGSAAG